MESGRSGETDTSYPPSFAAITREGICDAIAGVRVSDLVAKYGTPLFVYDEASILSKVASLSKFETVRYAQKANSNIAVLDVLRRAGAVVDATSAGEIHRALAAGYPAKPVAPGQAYPIVFTADVFDREALADVITLGVHVNCGSEDMLEQYAEALSGRGGKVTLRINPGFGHGHSKKTNTGGENSKHGIWHEYLPAVVSRAAVLGLQISGLHVHIGSGTDLDHLTLVGESLERLARMVGPQLEYISAGGGLPVPYARNDAAVNDETLNAYFETWHSVRQRLEFSFGHTLRLEIEPGRYVVAEAGYLLTEVRTVKSAGTNRFVLLDAGFNCLVRPAMYGASHPMALAPQAALNSAQGGTHRATTALDAGSTPRVPILCTTNGTITSGVEEVSAADEADRSVCSGAIVGSTGDSRSRTVSTGSQSRDFVVGGPLCESGDVFTVTNAGDVTTVRLPASTTVGDVLVIGLCGAYAFTMASTYNSRTLPAEVLIDARKQQPHLVRKRQSVADLMRGEVLQVLAQ